MSLSANDKYFRPGQYLFREGEPSRCMFLIRKGTVSVRKVKGAAYVEVGRAYSNEVLGELSFFDRLPRSAAAVALTEVEVLEISFDSLDKIYVGVPDYLKTIIACVADRLRKANDTIKRLQKNVVHDTAVGPAEVHSHDELSAADILTATDERTGDGPGPASGAEEDPEDGKKTGT